MSVEVVTFSGECRESETEERVVTARLMPYGEVALDVPYPKGERFLPGALTKSLHDWARSARPLKLFRSHEHRQAIGLAIGYEPEAVGGPTADFRIARTTAGDAALEEIREGLLDSISIGFRAVREKRARDGVRDVHEAALIETSLSPLGAYGGAQVLAVREPSKPLDLERFRLPEPPKVDLDAPLWSGLR